MPRVIFVGELYYADLQIGGGPVYPRPPQPGEPGFPAHPIYQPGEPTHPIVLPPTQPPGIWGGAPLPWPTPPIYYPPGYPAHPIYTPPGYPAHPIAGPPGGSPEHPWVPPQPPLGIWGGAPLPMPTPPIYYPTPPPGYPAHPIQPPPGYPAHPIQPPPGFVEGGVDKGDWVYSPVYGWVWVPSTVAHPPGPEHPIVQPPEGAQPEPPHVEPH
jgi:hypothetical protein